MSNAVPRGMVPMLAAVGVFGSIAVHMLVPALPALAVDFAVKPGMAQRAVSFYLLGLAIGQLVCGPLADRFGRRPVMVGGLTLFMAGALGAAFAPGFEWLLAARVVQAAGGAAGIVVSRVIVADLFHPSEGGRRQADLMSVVLLSPAIAPAIGGFMVDHGGWRWIMGVQAVAAAGVLAMAVLILRETMAPHARAKGKIVENCRRVLGNGDFRRIVACIACSTGTLYMFLATSPFLLISQWGLSESEAGICFLVTALTAILGTQMVKRLDKSHDTLRVGVTCAFTGSVLALLFALTVGGHWWALIGPVLLMTLGAGMTAPSGTARVLQLEKGLSATASSLAGAIQIGFSGLVTVILASLVAPSFLGLAIAMVVLASCALAIAPRQQEPAIVGEDNA